MFCTYEPYTIRNWSKNDDKSGPNHNRFSAGGRGASVSACAGLTNQLLSRWVDSRIAWIKNTDTAIVGDRWMGVGDTRNVRLYC